MTDSRLGQRAVERAGDPRRAPGDGQTLAPNVPLGEGRGIHPGRVVWAHDPAVAQWDGRTGLWWEDGQTSQAASDRVLAEAIERLTGCADQASAWSALFRHLNRTARGIDAGGSPGQRIAIKLNLNNTQGHGPSAELNASPQLALSLLRSLVGEAGVAPDRITLFDASRFIPEELFRKCHAEFPEAIYADHCGGDGRARVSYVPGAIPYSIDNGRVATGLAACAVEADYLIDVALLRGHEYQGVTLCAKNFYGATSIAADWSKNAHDHFDAGRDGHWQYLTFVDFLGHRHLGRKTVLFLVDGFYGSTTVTGAPALRWKLAPFHGRWPSTLLASQDGVAIDSVGLDLIRSEWPDLPDLAWADRYLIEAALAHDPPSGTFYDPERTGQRLPSLGVVERWSGPQDQRYARDLGQGGGIELVRAFLGAPRT